MLTSFIRVWISLLGITLLSSCMVGPDFHSPPSPQTEKYTESTLPNKTVSTPRSGNAGASQVFVQGEPIPAQWWYLFHSPELNHLIDIGLAHSPNLASTQAALLQAQELVAAQIGTSLWPAFGSQVQGQRQRFAVASIGSTGASPVFNLVNANVNVSYTLDFFGGARRQIESLIAQEDYQRYQFIAAYLTLTSNIVTTAITCSSLAEQIQVTKQLISEQQGQLDILNKQFRLGGIASTNVLTQQTLVQQTRAQLPPLEKSLSQSLHALSVLVGDFPEVAFKPIKLSSLQLPREIPISLPSELIRQRPDIQASEALLHSALAKVGVATANLYPQITITGNYGWSANAPGELFSSASKVWLMGLNITQPIFQGGALRAQRRAAIQAYKQALAQYRQVVLQAFQNVADSLRAIETDARALRASQAAASAALQSQNVINDQYRLGGASYLSLLNAQQQYQQTRIQVIQARAARFTDTAALYQALGGGWWNRQSCKYWNCGQIVMGTV